ncbi:MAG TPA: hypothetical protein VGG19_10305 [Tepidisphaeraceae bacterium]|jgi:hypothetical protein
MKAAKIVWLVLNFFTLCGRDLYAQKDPLPSWNDGPSKTVITDFVTKVTTLGSYNFIKPEDRIATFENDGKLWSEQSMDFQFIFANARGQTRLGLLHQVLGRRQKAKSQHRHQQFSDRQGKASAV